MHHSVDSADPTGDCSVLSGCMGRLQRISPHASCELQTGASNRIGSNPRCIGATGVSRLTQALREPVPGGGRFPSEERGLHLGPIGILYFCDSSTQLICPSERLWLLSTAATMRGGQRCHPDRLAYPHFDTKVIASACVAVRNRGRVILASG